MGTFVKSVLRIAKPLAVAAAMALAEFVMSNVRDILQDKKKRDGERKS